MKYLKILLMTIVSLSLVLNIVLLNKIGDLEERINYLQTNNQQIQSTVNSIPGQIHQYLSEIKQMESWITPISINVEKSDSVKTDLMASWQIKDYDQGSVVLFHYRVNGEEFKKIEAIDKGQGYFEAGLSLNLKLEPQWFVDVQDEGKSPPLAFEKVKKDLDQTMEYYVSVIKEDNIKSSEISFYNLNGLANRLYGNLHIGVYANNQNRYDIHLDFEAFNHTQKIENVFLKSYYNDRLLSTSSLGLINDDGGYRQSYYIGFGYQKNDEEFNRLVLEVTYPNNNVFRKEVYTK